MKKCRKSWHHRKQIPVHCQSIGNLIYESFVLPQFLELRLPSDKPVTIYKGHRLAWDQDKPVDCQWGAEFRDPAIRDSTTAIIII